MVCKHCTKRIGYSTLIFDAGVPINCLECNQVHIPEETLHVHAFHFGINAKTGFHSYMLTDEIVCPHCGAETTDALLACEKRLVLELSEGGYDGQ